MKKIILSAAILSSTLLTNQSLYANDDIKAMLKKIELMQEAIKNLKSEVSRLKNSNEVISTLQENIEELKENDESIESTIDEEISLAASGIKLNGYADAYYAAYSGKKNKDRNDGFRNYRFSLIPNQQVNDKFRWLAEIEFEDTPRIEPSYNSGTVSDDSTGSLFLERVYLQYDYNQYLKFRLGRDFTHSTIWSDNHYPTFVLNEYRPLLERNIFPQVTDGLEVLGNTMIGKVGVDYIVYTGNGNSYYTHEDLNDKDLYGARVRFTLPFLSLTRLSLAVADGYTTDNILNSNYDKTSFAIGLEQKWNNAELKAQYAYANIEDTNKYDRDGYYVQLSYKLGDFTPWIQYEEYDASDKDGLEAVDRKAVGLQYSLYSNLKFKLVEYLMDDDKQTLAVGTFNF